MEEKLEDFLKGKNIKVKLIKLDEFKGNNSKLINFKKNNPDTMLIFEDLWKNKTDIIKSIISVKLDSKIKKYHARKLTIKEVPQQLSKKFLDENHLQGNCKSSIKLGLYDNEELIQIMTFGKARFSKSASYELIRLATKKYSVVVGGTQRLFNYFIKKYNNPSIVSYDDEMIFTGSIYEKLGFKLKSNKVRGYSYYNDTDKVRIGRTYFQKSKLTSVLRSVDMTLSEEENCENNGWHKIYDCGQATWLYNPLSLRDKVKINIEDRWNLEWLNPEKRISKNIDYSFKCKKCGLVFKQKIRFDRNLSCPNCHPSDHGSSKGEMELYDILNTSGKKIIHNDRNILNGKELDIYFPDISFAIEYDGKYWHNEEKDNLKNKLCEEKGIELLRVDDNEFNTNKDLVLNNIKNILSKKFGDFEINLNNINSVDRVSGRCKKIICLNDNMVYDNYSDVLNAYGLKNKYDVLNTCNGNFKNYNGYSFRYYDENQKYSLKDRKYNYHVRHIKCLDTGEVFESLNEVKRMGIKTIFDCLSNRQKKAHGLKWEYTDDDVTDNKKTMNLINKKEKIVCVETGEEYNSIKEAVEKTNILGIEAVLNGRRKTAGKYHWIKK